MTSSAVPVSGGATPALVGAVPGRKILALQEQFLADPAGTDLSLLRPVIARSWQRSLACNVTSTAPLVELSDPRVDEQLLMAAEPILTELERLCIDSGGSVILTDAEGTINVFRGDPVQTRKAEQIHPIFGARMGEDLIGTNSDGTVLEEGEAVQVWGAEHFNEVLQNSYCTSVPVRDPIRRSIRGVLGIMLPEHVARTTNPRSILLLVHGAAAEITRRLAERLAVREQALMAEYMSEIRKRGADAVVAMDDRTTIASRSALSMLNQSDFAVLAALAREAEQGGQTLQRNLSVGTGREISLQIRPMNLQDLSIGRGSVMRVHVPTQPKRLVTGSKTRASASPFDSLIGTSRGLRRALDAAAAAASRHMPAYVVGEQGTGKQRLAETLAAQLAETVQVFDFTRSPADSDTIAAIDSSLSEGSAVVLHRIERCSPEVKEDLAALFNLLEQPQVIVTVTTVPDDILPILSALRGIEVKMPPLRERREDIPALAINFLQRFVHPDATLSPKLRDALVAADWPGNVSQLQEVMESIAPDSFGKEKRLADLPSVQLRALTTARLTRLEEAELQQIRAALAEAGGNRVRAANLLGIGRSTLYRKIEAYEARGFDLELG